VTDTYISHMNTMILYMDDQEASSFLLFLGATAAERAAYVADV